MKFHETQRLVVLAWFKSIQSLWLEVIGYVLAFLLNALFKIQCC
ncbi:hypothetical protein AT1219_190003 [Vibrio alginolyticus]